MEKEKDKSAFIVSSLRERIALNYFNQSQNDFIVTQMSPVEGYAKWDAMIMSGYTQEMLLEIKVRDWHSISFSTWIMEEDKYQALLKIKDKLWRDVTPYYVNVFRDGVAFFNLNEITPTFIDRDSKKSVMDQTQGRKIKRVAMLPLSAATFYPIQIDINLLNSQAELAYENIYQKKPEKLFKNPK